MKFILLLLEIGNHLYLMTRSVLPFLPIDMDADVIGMFGFTSCTVYSRPMLDSRSCIFQLKDDVL